MERFNGYVFKLNPRCIFNFKKPKEEFEKRFKVVEVFDKKEPVYRSDYIEPYEFKYYEFVKIQDIETGNEKVMSLGVFKSCFKLEGN